MLRKHSLFIAVTLCGGVATSTYVAYKEAIPASRHIHYPRSEYAYSGHN